MRPVRLPAAPAAPAGDLLERPIDGRAAGGATANAIRLFLRVQRQDRKEEQREPPPPQQGHEFGLLAALRAVRSSGRRIGVTCRDHPPAEDDDKIGPAGRTMNRSVTMTKTTL